MARSGPREDAPCAHPGLSRENRPDRASGRIWKVFLPRDEADGRGARFPF